MTGQQLKNSILQLAVQGKLVPQDPADEPASVLLSRIREEKEQLIHEKKIKREKNPSQIFRGDDGHFYERVGKADPVCIDEELPFEIPETWEWARFGTVLINRDAERIPLSVNERLKLDKIYDYYGASGVIDKVDRFLFEKPLLLIGEDGANLLLRSKPIAFIATGKYWVNNHAHVLDAISYTILEYVAHYINATNLAPYVTGTAQPKMNQQKMNSILLAIPPHSEQKRIIAKIEELLPYVERYEQSQNKLEKLNTTFPDQLKKSILQEAIQGKLVPQDPADEPASALLERIRAEKDQLTRDDKIKREKNPSQIFRGEDGHFYERIGKNEPVCIDEELPFEIPETWEWVRFSEFGIYKKGPFGSALTKSMFVPKGQDTIKVYEQKNAIQKDATLGDYYITNDYFISKMSGFEILPGDVIVSCAGTIGETFILPVDMEKGIINQALMRMRIFSPVYIPYFLFVFDTLLKQNARSGSKGSAIKNIPPFKVLNNYLVPLPPLAEQQRIVEKLEQILSLCEHLTERV